MPFRSTPFTGATSAVQPVIPNQIFHATDTNTLYIANSLTLGDISPYGGGSSGGGGSSVTVGVVTPIGNVTPGAADEIYIWDYSTPPGGSGNSQGTKQVYYRSTGTNNTDWEAYGGTAVIYLDSSIFDEGDSADFVGQHAYQFSSGSSSPSYNAGYVAYQVGQGTDDFVQIF